MDAQEIWQTIKKHFAEKMTPVSYDAWIETSDVISVSEGTIEILVSGEAHQKYWETQLAPQVIQIIYSQYQIELEPIILTEEDLAHSTPVAKSTSYLSQNNKSSQSTFKKNNSRLNGKYTFENFVVGKGNEMAHATALAVAEHGGTFYNPLFFYGGVGLGKTHLMQAIGHETLRLNPQANVKYVTSEQFMNDFVSSIQRGATEDFRQEYRNVDLLLVDDVQFFGDKEGTQEEFFHTFNELHNDHKQIVLSSDRLPNEIPQLEERLVSRFAWGLSVDITPPDLETRTAILRSKAEAENLEISSSTIDYIAGQIDSNVRELEGALLRVQAYATMKGEEISTSIAADALKSLVVNNKPKEITIEAVMDAVSEYYEVSVEKILGRSRVQHIVRPRQIAMYLSRELTDESFPNIGKEFGGKDHTTVLYAHEKIENEILENNQLKDQISEIKERLN